MKPITHCPACSDWKLPGQPHTCHSREQVIAQWVIDKEQLRNQLAQTTDTLSVASDTIEILEKALGEMTVAMEMWKLQALQANVQFEHRVAQNSEAEEVV